MKTKNERAEIRGVERRAYPVQLEVRSASSGGPASVEGYASVVDVPFEMFDMFGSYSEVVRPGAFSRTLNANPQVQLLLNHAGLAMAYTKAGTLQLSEDSTGLHMRAEVNPARSDVQDMLTALADGNVDEMSFAFRVTRQMWSPDYDQRDIQEVDLHRGDVSVVNFGANPGTSVALDVSRMSPAAARELRARIDERLAVSLERRAAVSFGDLPLADRDRAWDKGPATGRVAKWASSDGSGDKEKVSWSKYRRAFFWYDSSAPEAFGSYKLPFADVVDGTLTAIPRAIFSAAAVMQGSMGGANIPSGDVAGVKAAIARYYAKMAAQFKDDSIVPPWSSKKSADGELETRWSVLIEDDDDGDDTVPCPACGAMNDADAQFCDQCGASMTPPASPYSPQRGGALPLSLALAQRDALGL